MSGPIEWRPRIQIDVGEDLARRMNRAIPWGIRNEIMRVIFDDLVTAMEKVGGNVLAYMLINRQLTLFGGIADDGLKEIVRAGRAEVSQ